MVFRFWIFIFVSNTSQVLVLFCFHPHHATTTPLCVDTRSAMKIGNTRACSAEGVGLFWALFALFFSRWTYVGLFLMSCIFIRAFSVHPNPLPPTKRDIVRVRCGVRVFNCQFLLPLHPGTAVNMRLGGWRILSYFPVRVSLLALPMIEWFWKLLFLFDTCLGKYNGVVVLF